jgi:AcrR family transcriptional regulator
VPRPGLSPAAVTEAGAALADEIGFDRLTMGLVAERLQIKTPSLYNHVESLSDLVHRIAVLAATELGDALRDAIQGRAGSDALFAAAVAMRSYVNQHPGRYAAGNHVRPGGPDDPLTPAIDRMLAPLSAVLRGYELDPGHEIHALRMLRSWLHGFATLEVEGGFRFDTDIEESFLWIVQLLDSGLRSSPSWTGSTPARVLGTTTTLEPGRRR